MEAGRQASLDAAFEQIEQSILPTISLLLDSLLDAAAAARPGIDAERYAAELRTMALDVEDLTRRVEAVA
nr:hypothetical protein [Pseudomonadota bacterium]